MRDFQLFIPSDCVVSIEKEDNEYALRQMEEVLKADITPARELDLAAIKAEAERNFES